MVGPDRCAVKVRAPYDPKRSADGRLSGHLGVDFSVCDDSVVVAIADGVVGYSDIGRSTDDSSYEYSGGIINIWHEVPGQPNQPVLYAYAHVSDIRVGTHDRVIRGQVIGRPWVPKEGGGWIPHVHLEIIGDRAAPLDALDPLRLIKGCMSRTKPNEYVYPISC
jgi:murein DD-endopeptidase MepM/ murein hydrolase activator NlpD